PEPEYVTLSRSVNGPGRATFGVYVGSLTPADGANVPPAPESVQRNVSANWLDASVNDTARPLHAVLSPPAFTSGQQVTGASSVSMPCVVRQAAADVVSVHSGTSSSGSTVNVRTASGQESVIGCV